MSKEMFGASASSEERRTQRQGNGALPHADPQLPRPLRIRRKPAPRISFPRNGIPEVGMEGHQDTMEAVGRLAGQVSHHLNNLLTVVGGNAAVLEKELVDRRFAPELEDIKEACTRVSDLSRQLLSISGRRWAEPHLVDLRTLVSEMDLGRLFEGSVGFCTDFAVAPCPVRVDPSHLEEVVLGLARNASEAVGSRGTVRIGIDPLPWKKLDGAPAQGCVQLEVSDSGQGMELETLERVFHPFFGTHPFSEDRGLGLSVAYGIVRQSGGTMKVASAPGAGTTVRIWLPTAGSGPPSGQCSG